MIENIRVSAKSIILQDGKMLVVQQRSAESNFWFTPKILNELPLAKSFKNQTW